MAQFWNHGPKGCRSQLLVFLVSRASPTNPWTSFPQLAASLFVTSLKHRMLHVWKKEGGSGTAPPCPSPAHLSTVPRTVSDLRAHGSWTVIPQVAEWGPRPESQKNLSSPAWSPHQTENNRGRAGGSHACARPVGAHACGVLTTETESSQGWTESCKESACGSWPAGTAPSSLPSHTHLALHHRVWSKPHSLFTYEEVTVNL